MVTWCFSPSLYIGPPSPLGVRYLVPQPEHVLGPPSPLRHGYLVFQPKRVLGPPSPLGMVTWCFSPSVYLAHPDPWVHLLPQLPSAPSRPSVLLPLLLLLSLLVTVKRFSPSKCTCEQNVTPGSVINGIVVFRNPRARNIRVYYRPQTKLRECNVFTGVCHSFCQRGGKGLPSHNAMGRQPIPPPPRILLLVRSICGRYGIVLECILVWFIITES